MFCVLRVGRALNSKGEPLPYRDDCMDMWKDCPSKAAKGLCQQYWHSCEIACGVCLPPPRQKDL